MEQVWIGVVMDREADGVWVDLDLAVAVGVWVDLELDIGDVEVWEVELEVEGNDEVWEEEIEVLAGGWRVDWLAGGDKEVRVWSLTGV